MGFVYVDSMRPPDDSAISTLDSPRPGACPPPQKKLNLWQRLGPGLITGASDDDPSGIGTYSQAGAAFGYTLLWTMPFCLPLMAAVQEISARLGRITGHGLAGNIRRHYSAWFLFPTVGLLLIANIINLAADIGAMGDALRLLIGGPALAYAVGFSVLCVAMQVFLSYPRCSSILKWLTPVLLSYVVTVLLVHVNWKSTLHGLFIPQFQRSGAYWATFIAVLGTTISPYLFFWQASQETEEIRADPAAEPLAQAPEQAPEQLKRIRLDTYVGMTASNIAAAFIVMAAAATLNARGITDIETSTQAAEALKPLGSSAFFFFSLSIIGTGLLAVPVLAGSAAYAVGEAMRWRTGLDHKLLKARGFYAVITIATLLGCLLNFPFIQRHTHITPIRALFWSAVINGVTAVPVMVMMMLMSGNAKVVADPKLMPRGLRIVGWIATAVMAAASVGMFVTWKSA
jgi:NRAMP (natural resistance-associated macrophage protein)-like metal ion transporter